jgi:hypothetical protein
MKHGRAPGTLLILLVAAAPSTLTAIGAAAPADASTVTAPSWNPVLPHHDEWDYTPSVPGSGALDVALPFRKAVDAS